MSEWISVEEELPQDLEEVLAYYPTGDFTGDIYICEYRFTLFWHTHPDCRCSRDEREVTHWMPLPGPPIKAAEKKD